MGYLNETKMRNTITRELDNGIVLITADEDEGSSE